MNNNVWDPGVQSTRDLLRSLQQSIWRLRQEAEELREKLADEGAEALAATVPRLTKLEGLIRDCQKVEKALVEQSDQDPASKAGIDLDAARAEIRSRLDRLRTSLDHRPDSE